MCFVNYSIKGTMHFMFKISYLEKIKAINNTFYKGWDLEFLKKYVITLHIITEILIQGTIQNICKMPLYM